MAGVIVPLHTTIGWVAWRGLIKIPVKRVGQVPPLKPRRDFSFVPARPVRLLRFPVSCRASFRERPLRLEVVQSEESNHVESPHRPVTSRPRSRSGRLRPPAPPRHPFPPPPSSHPAPQHPPAPPPPPPPP